MYVMHFLPFLTIKTLTLRMDHAKLLDALTSLLFSQYYLVPCALLRHIRQTMQYVVLLTRVDMHLGQSEDVYL